MSAFQVNGSDISGMTATFSWGLSPASGNVTLPGAVTGVGAGTEFVITLGGLTFHGVVAKSTVERNDGDMTVLEVVDNRVRLMWDDVYCTFNNQEVREDDPSTPGIDRQKRFWHILPEDWDAQIKTWTEIAYSAKQIIDKLIAAPTVAQTWVTEYHAAQDQYVLGIDAAHGPKLGNVLQDISERQGLVFTLDGEHTLRWARKGEGDAAVVPSGAFGVTDGDALSHNDTQVRLVGDRNVYQDMPIELFADWRSSYEAFWSEPAWFAEVNTRFGPYADTKAGQALLAAKANSVTVREYVTARGDASYADYALWGEVGRMEIPAWLYIRDIVFKAYQVPYGYTINGIPRDSLELREGLLAACTFTSDTGVFSLKSPREFYPDSKAIFIAQGQQISLLDTRSRDVITATQLAAARTAWSACNKYNLDTKNKLVIFQDAMIVPGEGTHGLLVFPNQGVDGIDETHELYNLAVPNADVTITAAAVRAVMTFEAEVYSKRYGSGNRKGSRQVKDLCYHALMDTGVFSEEVKYADGEGAEDKADTEAASLIIADAVYRAGKYSRAGSAGTALSPVLDRVTVTLSFEEGLVETVEHTKERNQSNFEHEREMDRRSRQKELFPGQRANKTEVDNLKIIARISKELPRDGLSPYKSVAAVMQRPVGAMHSSPNMVKLGDATDAGTVIWKDEDGVVASSGDRLAGVVIADASQGFQVALATQGTVPVKIKGPFAAGDAVGANDDGIVVKGGTRNLGMVNASYTGTVEVLAPVRLGAGAAEEERPFELISADDDDGAKVRVVISTILGGSPDGFVDGDDPPFILAVNDGDVIYGVVTIDVSGEFPGAVTSRSLDTGATVPDDDPIGGTFYRSIGTVSVTTDAGKSTSDPSNVRYGPLEGTAFRVWFSDPKQFEMDWAGS